MSFVSHLRAAWRDDERLAAVARARRALLAGREPEPDDRDAVRSVVLESWRRSPMRPIVRSRDDRTEPRGTRLRSAADGLVSETGADLSTAGLALAIIDAEGTQLTPLVGDSEATEPMEAIGFVTGAALDEHSLGTNGAGAALETMSAFGAMGPDHLVAGLQEWTTVGVPVRDHNSHVLGAVLVVGALADSGAAAVCALQFARRLGAALQQEAAQVHRKVLTQFQAASRRPSQPVMYIAPDLLIANAAARQQILTRPNADAIAVAVSDAAGDRPEAEVEVEVAGGLYAARVRQAAAGTPGVIARFYPRSFSRTPLRRHDPLHRLRRAFESNLNTFVVGEPLSGKGTLVRDAVDGEAKVWVTDVWLIGPDPAEWLGELEAAAERERVVLVTHIHDLPVTLQARFRAIILGANAWCVGTANAFFMAGGPLDGTFPVGVLRSPLRDRRDEIERIVRRALDDLGMPDVVCDPQVLAVFSRHPWPGNVAQLKRVLGSAAMRATSGVIAFQHLPPRIVADADHGAGGALGRTERELLFRTLRDAEWNREAAAAALGVSRSTIYRRIKQYGITIPTRPRGPHPRTSS